MAQTIIRYASDPLPYFVTREQNSGGVGGGYYWTRDPHLAHVFPSRRAAQAMAARFLPLVPQHRLSLSSVMVED